MSGIKECFKNAFCSQSQEVYAKIKCDPTFREAEASGNHEAMLNRAIEIATEEGFWQGAAMLEYLKECAACAARNWE